MSNPNKPIVHFYAEILDDAMDMLKGIQLIVKDIYRVEMQLGFNGYFICVYKDE